MPTEAPMALEHEMATYRKEHDKLLAHAGKYVVISGDRVVGVFAAYEDALREGYKACGIAPFLVKLIERIETAHFFSRDVIPPCRT